ncbi:MAG: hypothetical protein EB127_16090 [Alphaproteobacteria bacterium]|nr:hypothetical protein [Alphaproteobacteria bacterium]
MFDVFNNDDDEMTEIINQLVKDGYLIKMGYDENDEPLYQTTKKFRSTFPEFYEEQIKETNEVIFQLWNMGLIDMTVKEEINEWIVMPNNNTYSCNLESLTKQQRSLINYIRQKS